MSVDERASVAVAHESPGAGSVAPASVGAFCERPSGRSRAAARLGPPFDESPNDDAAYGGESSASPTDQSESGGASGEPLAGEAPAPYRGTGRQPRWYGYTAFVLSGGGARGALQVGALRALLERGIRPDILVGTSIGAWNAAVLGQDPTLTGIAHMEEIWRSLTSSLVMLGREPSRHAPTQAVNGALTLAAARHVARGHASLYNNAGALLMAARYLGDRTFADLRLPVSIIAANLMTGTRRVFSSGPLAPAVIASSAIPGIFPPVSIDDDVYVDGGALDNLNLDVALAAGARRLFILDVGYDEHERGEAYWREALAHPSKANRSGEAPLAASAHPLAVLLERTVQVASHYHAQRELERLPLGIETYVLQLRTGGAANALAFGKASEWMEIGYRAVQEQLPAHLSRSTPAQLDLARPLRSYSTPPLTAQPSGSQRAEANRGTSHAASHAASESGPTSIPATITGNGEPPGDSA